ncbi:alpha/beta hydrolase family protein [Acidicapsa acidisoli]|uniref:alpha/beta hydrolase family protein n=1 Tax=Acidicapsa acidisoli TaxID=1615681 RepID=UPI0021DFFA10|nr:acetylxylan esterase [Acidicapsa acidisoli]
MKGSIYLQLAYFTAIATMYTAIALGQNSQTTTQPLNPTRENAPPAEAFRVLSSSELQDRQITPYLAYQTALAWNQDELRRDRWSQVKSASDLLQLRAELRRSVLDMIGGLPAKKTDLHATITGTIAANGFHIEKLVYQSLPGFYVTALVYVPENNDKVHPAILVPAGHSPVGKAHYQALCQRLVLRGYLVISWDPVGQGERSQFWDAKEKKSRYNLICAEHAVMGNLAYLAGANLARWEIWDGIRAVDYLLTRSDVDGERINITGTSGGGFQTALIGALDERIKVVIPSCYITALPMRVENRIFADPDSDPEQDLFGFLSKGVDDAGILLMMYPRPVMVATATLDYFPVQGARKSYSEVSAFYKRFGYADRIAFVESYNGHEYSVANQETALGFLDRFNKMPVRHGLPPVTTFSDADLQVSRSGQVTVDFPEGYTLPHFIAAHSDEASLRNSKTLRELYRSERDPDVDSWTVSRYAGYSPPRELRWEAVGSRTAGAVQIDRYVLHHSSYLEMPLLHFHLNDNHPKGAILWFSLDGKASEKDWPQISKLLQDGYEVFSFDFRGLGETRMNYRAVSSDAPDLAQDNFDAAYVNPLASVLADYVYNSLLTGRPYFFEMMDDLKIAELFVRSRNSHSNREPVTLAATGEARSLATLFKEIDPQVTILPSDARSDLIWSKLVAEGQEQWPIAFLMPYGATVKTESKTEPR